jgi:hypothetical protein
MYVYLCICIYAYLCQQAIIWSIFPHKNILKTNTIIYLSCTYLLYGNIDHATAWLYSALNVDTSSVAQFNMMLKLYSIYIANGTMKSFFKASVFCHQERNQLGTPRWQLEGGSRKFSYSEILERHWKHTLQAKSPRRGKTLTPPHLQPARRLSTSR